MAEKPKKPQKLRARLPRGLEDRGPAAINATRQMVEKIRAVYERYGFEPVETPAFEYTDALGKFLPDQDRPNEGVLSFLQIRLGVPQRKARPRPLPSVHAIRRRHGRRADAGRRRRDVHDGGGYDGSARHPAWLLCGESEQPQGAGWGARRARHP